MTSDALCRALSPRWTGSSRSSWDLPGRPGRASRDAVANGTRRPHRTRPAGPAAGLGRRAPREPGRLPSDRPGACAPGRQCRARCSRSRPCPRTLSLAASPIPPRQRLMGRFEPSRRWARHGSLRDRVAPCFAARKMRLTDFCNRRSTRALRTLLDSRPRVSSSHEALRPRDLLACADPPMTRSPEACAPLEPPLDEPSGGASLDGEPPASASSATLRAISRSRSPERSLDSSTARLR
jgi:hypothetical protein